MEKVKNFTEILQCTPFKYFVRDARIQDFLAHELPYGECHGFHSERENVFDISLLVKRLAYIREIFVVARFEDGTDLLKKVFAQGRIDKNVQIFRSNGYSLVRLITNQYFLEKSEYISKLSRNENEVDKNIDILFGFLTKNIHRIPATATMQVGKRLEDYFTIREEPSLYLTHYMHPYKGRFHPKMVRALLNYVYPQEKGLVMDNFAGCGTLLVEANCIGLDSVGIEINPLSALMSKVKCDSLSIPAHELKEAIDEYIQKLRLSITHYWEKNSESPPFPASKHDPATLAKRKAILPSNVISLFNNEGIIDEFIIAHELIRRSEIENVRDFLVLALSGTISDLLRRRSGSFLEVFRDRLENLCLRIYIFQKLNEVLRIDLGRSKTFVADTRNMEMIDDESIDAIVNSPPYSTALDYVKNDYPQLTLLELGDIQLLEKNTIGTPKLKVYQPSLLQEIRGKNPEFMSLPETAKSLIAILSKYDRTKEALRTYKFFKDMQAALREMHRVMKKGSKCVIIIGNNHYRIKEDDLEVKNDEVLKEIAMGLGFEADRSIMRELEKTRTGMIRYETILILKKTDSP